MLSDVSSWLVESHQTCAAWMAKLRWTGEENAVAFRLRHRRALHAIVCTLATSYAINARRFLQAMTAATVKAEHTDRRVHP